MAKVADVFIERSPDQLSNLNDIWGNTVILGLSSSVLSVYQNSFEYFIAITLYDKDLNTIDLGVYSFPPKPSGIYLDPGFGMFSFSNPLKSFFNLMPNYSSVSPVESTSYALPKSIQSPIIQYGFTTGFKYNPNLKVNAYETVFGGNSYLSFTFSTPNPFEDTMSVKVFSNNPFISGDHTILSGFSTTYSFVTTTAFTQSMISGTTDATIIQYFQTSEFQSGFYGVDCRLDYKYYSSPLNPHIVNGSIGDWGPYGESYKFLNTYPNRNNNLVSQIATSSRPSYFLNAKPIEVGSESWDTLSFVLNTNTFQTGVTGSFTMWYETYSPTYSLINTFTFSIPYTTDVGLLRFDTGVGWGNMQFNFAQPNNTEYLVCYIADENRNLYSETRVFKYERNCSIYDKKLFMWKNKLGAWDYWTFTQDTKETRSISRNEYKQESNYYNLSLGFGFFRGRNIYGGKVNSNFTCNTNWISESQYEYLSDMVESSDVYIFTPTLEQSLKPIPIIINDTSYELKTSIRDQIFNLTINYTIAYDNKMQSGQ